MDSVLSRIAFLSQRSFKLFSKIFLYFPNKFFVYNFINIKWHTDGKYRTIILWVRKLNPMCKFGILESQLLIQLPQQNLPNVVLVVATRCWAHSPPVSKSDLRWPQFENQLINKVSVAWKSRIVSLFHTMGLTQNLGQLQGKITFQSYTEGIQQIPLKLKPLKNIRSTRAMICLFLPDALSAVYINNVLKESFWNRETGILLMLRINQGLVHRWSLVCFWI